MFAAVGRCVGLLSDPTRFKIVQAICGKECSVSAIVAATGATQANASRHLARMHQAGVVSRRREGSCAYCRVNNPEFVDTCRNVCVRIAGRIDARQPLKNDLLEFAANHRRQPTGAAMATREEEFPCRLPRLHAGAFARHRSIP